MSTADLSHIPGINANSKIISPLSSDNSSSSPKRLFLNRAVKALTSKNSSGTNHSSEIESIIEPRNKKNSSMRHSHASLPCLSTTSITALPLTRSHFLDVYSKGKWNLSTVPAPPCFEGIGILKPPEAYHEAVRLGILDSLINAKQWENHSAEFLEIIKKVTRIFGVKGASISLISCKFQEVKYQHNLGFDKCPRFLSIDAHAILSMSDFVLLDASKDWRTQKNPLVQGPPMIKFYCGVPICSRTGHVMGILAIFDDMPRSSFDTNQIKVLQGHVSKIWQLLETSDNMLDEKDKDKKMESIASPAGSKPLLPTNGTANPLFQQIGRATSNSISNTSFKLAGDILFDKDRSGSAYQSSKNFSISKHDLACVYRDRFDKCLWQKLLESKSMRKAAGILCEQICIQNGINLAYVAEIRVVERFKIRQSFFPPKNNSILYDNYKYQDQLVKSGEPRCAIRVYGTNSDRRSSVPNLSLDTQLHLSGFKSKLGLAFQGRDPKSYVKSGMVVPFFKGNAKLVKKKPEKKYLDTDMVELNLKSNGFVIVCVNDNPNKIAEEKVDGILKNAFLFRKIFLV
ncbi:Hypothetical protein PP7435_CHR3-0079 [Komagataella phaffii CBS 7435]|uniref:U2-snRNP associated splicing factor with similarity to the mammalian splicing factor SAP49 n=2 Tax=Komagataella phaffii TaxID=460519 RepID=C4R6G3_KOMPG|nr:U2-snRNP associated splicing factor with similarity to the mammalian splicing factor SAP49 [Komagataella phaffii GS115]AOA63354.1 GQ67_04220T0 [Komagataella phaffii]CAH2449008.1 Hypothetical protein BQ9382_C3-0485 [Komagataella phaffii CBS 7435]AOA68666.1 GQ68_04193T0 [Komagataella phaffii GS115]CAY71149.1 U2-snRNP associated splicing factor with similarity to the mammalian splicing factor SAP49 [Komagataella phaffii GS115]CCA39053.1 Hypothetical protein PP7435_CHR3-0079 [Komagataella phaff